MDFEGPADLVTKVLGILPTKTWRKGDPTPKAGHSEKENGWSVDSGKAPADQLRDIVRRLVASLKGSRAGLAALGKNCYVELSLVLYIYGDERPALHLDADTVARLGEFGAHVDVDLYFL